MGLLDLIVLILILSWFSGLAFFNAGGLIHLLLVLAIIAILIRIIRGQTPL